MFRIESLTTPVTVSWYRRTDDHLPLQAEITLDHRGFLREADQSVLLPLLEPGTRAQRALSGENLATARVHIYKQCHASKGNAQQGKYRDIIREKR